MPLLALEPLFYGEFKTGALHIVVGGQLQAVVIALPRDIGLCGKWYLVIGKGALLAW